MLDIPLSSSWSRLVAVPSVFSVVLLFFIPGSVDIGFLIAVVSVFGLFAGFCTYFRLSARFEESKFERCWSMPIWSSSPVENPQSNRLMQVLAFGAFGFSGTVVGVLTGTNYTFAAACGAAGFGVFVGLMIFRLRHQAIAHDASH
jgi:hypothetical protein